MSVSKTSEPKEWEIRFEAEMEDINEEIRRERFDQAGFDALCKEREASNVAYRAFLKERMAAGHKFSRKSCDYEPSKRRVYSDASLFEWYFDDLEETYPEPHSRTPEQCNEFRMEVESRLGDYSHRKARLLEEEDGEKHKPITVALLDLELHRYPEGPHESTCDMEHSAREYWLGGGIWGASSPSRKCLRILYLLEERGEKPDFAESIRSFTGNCSAKTIKILSFYRYDPDDYMDYEDEEAEGSE